MSSTEVTSSDPLLQEGEQILPRPLLSYYHPLQVQKYNLSKPNMSKPNQLKNLQNKDTGQKYKLLTTVNECVETGSEGRKFVLLFYRKCVFPVRKKQGIFVIFLENTLKM